MANGLFGYLAFEAANFFDRHKAVEGNKAEIPMMRFAFYGLLLPLIIFEMN